MFESDFLIFPTLLFQGSLSASHAISLCASPSHICHRTGLPSQEDWQHYALYYSKVCATKKQSRSPTPTPIQWSDFEISSVWSDRGNLDNCMIDSLVFFLHFTEQALFWKWKGREILQYKMFEPAETHTWTVCTLKCTHTRAHKPTNYFWSVVVHCWVCMCASMSQLTVSLPFVSLPLPPQKAKEDHIKWGCCCVAAFGWVLREIWGKALL